MLPTVKSPNSVPPELGIMRGRRRNSISARHNSAGASVQTSHVIDARTRIENGTPGAAAVGRATKHGNPIADALMAHPLAHRRRSTPEASLGGRVGDPAEALRNPRPYGRRRAPGESCVLGDENRSNCESQCEPSGHTLAREPREYTLVPGYGEFHRFDPMGTLSAICKDLIFANPTSSVEQVLPK